LQRLYAFQDLPDSPITHKHISKTERNQRIITLYRRGDTLEEIAAAFGISHQRVHQIIQRWADEQGDES
jgi:DNA-directed RNA polymerase specialized sigma subunit